MLISRLASINQLKGLIYLKSYQNPLVAVYLAYDELIGLGQVMIKRFQLSLKVVDFSNYLMLIWLFHRPYGLKTPDTLLLSGGFSLPPQGASGAQRDLRGLIFSLVLLKKTSR